MRARTELPTRCSGSCPLPGHGAAEPGSSRAWHRPIALNSKRDIRWLLITLRVLRSARKLPCSRSSPLRSHVEPIPSCSNAGMSDDESPSEDGGGPVGGYIDLTFCAFPSLEPTPESEAAAQQQANGVYVPWELTAAPWQRLAKWMHQKLHKVKCGRAACHICVCTSC